MLENLQNQRVLITGVHGQVGRALTAQLRGKCQLITSAKSNADIELDITDHQALAKTIIKLKPQWVINPAAYTQVDQAESEQTLAFSVNGTAPGVMAEACKKIGATLIHYSTDYVFNGQATKAYKEDDPVDPVNIYGKSKLAGEQAIQAIDCEHLIFRTCWVYDAIGKNFLNTILERAKTMNTLKVVNDQFGTPTWARFIADISHQVLDQCCTDVERCSKGSRIFNLKPQGICSWYDFSEEIISYAKQYQPLAAEQLLAVTSEEFPVIAKRPLWSVLDGSKLMAHFGIEVAGWKKYAQLCLKEKFA
jgi:dTDP-4-dehydrorhamnose reductase